MAAELTLLGRPGCHLCEEARAVVAPLAREFGARLVEVDIESDDGLLARHLERIPVLLLDGEEVSELVVDAEDLRRRLGRVGHG